MRQIDAKSSFFSRILSYSTFPIVVKNTTIISITTHIKAKKELTIFAIDIHAINIIHHHTPAQPV